MTGSRCQRAVPPHPGEIQATAVTHVPRALRNMHRTEWGSGLSPHLLPLPVLVQGLGGNPTLSVPLAVLYIRDQAQPVSSKVLGLITQQAGFSRLLSLLCENEASYLGIPCFLCLHSSGLVFSRSPVLIVRNPMLIYQTATSAWVVATERMETERNVAWWRYRNKLG